MGGKALKCIFFVYKFQKNAQHIPLLWNKPDKKRGYICFNTISGHFHERYYIYSLCNLNQSINFCYITTLGKSLKTWHIYSVNLIDLNLALLYRETAGYWPILPEELKTSVRLVKSINTFKSHVLQFFLLRYSWRSRNFGALRV